MKTIVFSALLALTTTQAFAAKIVECLAPVKGSTTEFHKASISEDTRKNLRGNYVQGPKSLMTYYGTAVRDEGAGTYENIQPSDVLKSFKLVVSQTPTTIVANGLTITGVKAKLSVSGTFNVNNQDIVCGSPLKIK